MTSTLDARSRVTVVGARKRVDVAVPTAAPIGEYVAGLAELCGQERRHPLPASWSLAPPGSAALPLDASLGSSGVTDGEVLYLCDLARDPGADPVVDDVEELVTEQARAGREHSLPPGLVVIGFGLLWTVATGLIELHHPTVLIGPAVVLSLFGLVLVATAWSLHQRAAQIPAGLRLAIALAAVPCLAAAGALLADAVVGPAYGWCGAIAGANAAALLALAAIPEGVLIAVEVQFAAAALIVPLLLLAQATPAQAAATVVLLALSLLGLSKLLAAAIAAWSGRPARSASTVGQVVTDLLARSRRLLTAVIAGPAAALAVAFVVLARSGTGPALALAAVGGIALLVRARQRGFTGEIVLVGGAGMVGLFAVSAVLLARYAGATLRVAAFGVAGLAVLGLGVALTLMHKVAQPVSQTVTGLGDAAGVLAGTASRPNRLRFIDVIGMLCHLACASLALGVFGVFSDLVEMGRSIVG